MRIKREDKITIIVASIALIIIIGAAIYATAVKGNKTVEAESGDIVEFEEQEAEEGEIGNFEETIIVPMEDEEEKSEEEKEKTDKDTEKENNNTSDSIPPKGTKAYYIRVNKRANVVTVYGKDAEGNYTVPVKAMICSTGTYTPPCDKYSKNAYKTTGYKARWNYLQGAVYGQYATQITGNILFHSVPYTKKDSGSLEYWEYDKLGTSASLGCIRLTVGDAKWIYENVAGGTTVEFYYDSNPGPLGKPAAQKISSNTEYRDWDPTDPAPENPWKKVKQEEQKNEEKTNTTRTNTGVTNTTNTEKTNTEADKTNTVKTNTQTDKTNTVKTNTVKTNAEANKTNTEKTNTVKTNTEADKTNTVKTNTQTDKTNTVKTNTQTDKTNTVRTNTQTDKTNTVKTNTQTNNNNTVKTNTQTDKTNTVKTNKTNT